SMVRPCRSVPLCAALAPPARILLSVRLRLYPTLAAPRQVRSDASDVAANATARTELASHPTAQRARHQSVPARRTINRVLRQVLRRRPVGSPLLLASRLGGKSEVQKNLGK